MGGEHSSARSHVRAFLDNELKLGYLVPVSVDFVEHLLGTEVCHAYIVEQMTRKVNMSAREGGRVMYTDINKIVTETMSFLFAKTDSLSGADFGTYSVQCGAALSMYLSVTPVFNIMLQGCWSLDTFLVYINMQVVQVSVGISANMVQKNDFPVLPLLPHSTPFRRTKSSLAGHSSRKRDLTTSPRLRIGH